MPKRNSDARGMAMPLRSLGAVTVDGDGMRRQGIPVKELYLRRSGFLKESGIVLETGGKPPERESQDPAGTERI